MKEKAKSYDVVVVGAGISGVFAALAARKSGCSVALVEKNNVVGGQGTAGGVTGFCGDTQNVNNDFAELVARLAKFGHIADYEPNMDQRHYDREMCAFYLQEMPVERGVDIYFHSFAFNTHVSNGEFKSVDIAFAGGVRKLGCKFVIDATGNCEIASAGGLPCAHLGVNKQLPMSLYFTMLDTRKPVKTFLPPNCPQWHSDEEIPMTTIACHGDGIMEVKMKVIGFDAADGASYSEAEIAARGQMLGLIYYLQTHGYRGNKYNTYRLIDVSAMLGIREQRRIISRHVLTEDEISHSCVFDDAVAVGTYHFDYHWPDKLQRAGTGICTMVEPYHIPLRCMVPKGAKNILVPGRAAGGDQMAMSSFRVMATCAQMGTAAGTAAAMSINEAEDINDIKISKLQQELTKAGQKLDLSVYGNYLRFITMKHEHIFEQAPFDECHASTLAKLPNNRILASWFGGTKEGNDDVSIWIAQRFEGKWSAPREVANIRNEPHWNPVLFYDDQTGITHLHFKVGKPIDNWETWYTFSVDQGATWTEPVELVEGDRGGRGPVKNKLIVLSDGTWLAPASIEVGPGKKARWDTFVDCSEDGGKTWVKSDLVPIDHDTFKGEGIIQPSLWESLPGNVHMLIRSSCGYVCRADSDDYGKTWSEVYKTDIPNNNSGLDVAKLDDNTLAMVYNPVSGNWACRSPLRLALSYDNGKTWPDFIDLETEEGEFSYPAIIATANGMAVTYTWKRKRIVFWSGSIEHVKSGC